MIIAAFSRRALEWALRALKPARVIRVGRKSKLWYAEVELGPEVHVMDDSEAYCLLLEVMERARGRDNGRGTS